MTFKKFSLGLTLLLCAGNAMADDGRSRIIVTASNTSQNQLLIYSPSGATLDTIPTNGQGGVGGNAGGIAHNGQWLAVVNFTSSNVSVFRQEIEHHQLRFDALVPALDKPVSVAFGADHLYILSDSRIESHRLSHSGVDPNPDGSAKLLVANGSAAQVGVLRRQLIITEKANAIETVRLDEAGAITGPTISVADIPANVNAPFGLATAGNIAFVTIAHANEISLVADNTVQLTTPSGSQMAPCWLALDGDFLFSANSPSQSVSRYAVGRHELTQQVPVAAAFFGNPTDIAYARGLLAVVDANATTRESHVSIFPVDRGGNLAQPSVVTIKGTATNGIAILDQ